MTIKRRFIEEHFPIKEVSAEASRDKSVRHGHISTLHYWWARRPLAASRSTIYASLIPAATDAKEIECQKRNIAELSRWQNPMNEDVVNKARRHILSYNRTAPRVLDPFSGGGSIPLEALRLGCETYASDYNPVATLIVRATTEYPFQSESLKSHDKRLKSHEHSPLASDVKKWSQWIFDEARKDLEQFFPKEKDGGEPVGYIWSRCIPCQNPSCGATISLIKQFWLSNKKDKKIALLPVISGKKVTFKMVGDRNKKIPKDFDPTIGTISKGTATCLVCKHRVAGSKVKELFTQKKNSESMNVVITKQANKSGKSYRITRKDDLEIFNSVQNILAIKRKSLQQKYGIDPIPNEKLPPIGTLGFRVQRYGMNAWGDLFNDRQKLVLLTFAEKILAASRKMKEYSLKYTLPYLAIICDRLVVKNSNLVMYNVVGEKIENVFARQALPMIWDYVEVNPFTSVGWSNMEKWVLRVLEHLSHIDAAPATVKHTSATDLPFSDGFFDAVITDPPYYDNVPYSYLSDFFYVWLKRTIGSQIPDLFSTPLTPKTNEIVAYSNGPGGYKEGKEYFEMMLKKSFQEIHRVLKPDGISVIVYAHKSTEGWETLINSLLQSGLVVTAAWPIHTEMKTRLRSRSSAALRSSIYMVCRKWKKGPIGFYSDVKRELTRYLDKKLEQLWKEGISGADFFISSIGSAIEVYGKYDKVVDNRDESVPVLKLLDDTRTLVTNYAIDKVVKGEFVDKISQMTRFYVLWRWAHGEARVPFDDALKMSQSVGIDIEREWNRGFIRKDDGYVRVIGPDERTDNLEESSELIDILHHALILWKSQKAEYVDKFLASKGYEHSEVLRRVAQAISESLSGINSSKEKDWIDGFFTGLNMPKDVSQTKLL